MGWEATERALGADRVNHLALVSLGSDNLGPPLGQGEGEDGTSECAQFGPVSNALGSAGVREPSSSYSTLHQRPHEATGSHLTTLSLSWPLCT